MDQRAFSSGTFLNTEACYNPLHSNKIIFNLKIQRKENKF